MKCTVLHRTSEAVPTFLQDIVLSPIEIHRPDLKFKFSRKESERMLRAVRRFRGTAQSVPALDEPLPFASLVKEIEHNNRSSETDFRIEIFRSSNSYEAESLDSLVACAIHPVMLDRRAMAISLKDFTQGCSERFSDLAVRFIWQFAIAHGICPVNSSMFYDYVKMEFEEKNFEMDCSPQIEAFFDDVEGGEFHRMKTECFKKGFQESELLGYVPDPAFSDEAGKHRILCENVSLLRPQIRLRDLCIIDDVRMNEEDPDVDFIDMQDYLYIIPETGTASDFFEREIEALEYSCDQCWSIPVIAEPISDIPSLKGDVSEQIRLFNFLNFLTNDNNFDTSGFTPSRHPVGGPSANPLVRRGSRADSRA